MKLHFRLLGIAFGALIFIASFVGEWEHLSNLIEGRKTILTDHTEFQEQHLAETVYSKRVSHLFDNGVFLRIFAGAQFDILSDTLQLYSGKIFVNTKYFTQRSEVPFMVQAGKIKIFSLDASYLVELKEQDLLVAAFNHPVEILLNQEHPSFVIPAGMQTRFSLNNINQNTHRLHYTKLRKRNELNLHKIETFNEMVSQPNLSTPWNVLEQSNYVFENTLAQELKYSQSYVKSLFRMNPDSSLRLFSEISYQLRRPFVYLMAPFKYIPPEERQAQQKLYTSLTSKKTSIDQDKIESIALTLDAAQHKPLRYNTLQYLQTNEVDRCEKNKWEDCFYLFENKRARNNSQVAQQTIVHLLASFDQSSEINLQNITRYRRLWTEYLRQSPLYGNQTSFELLLKLVQRELLLTDDLDLKNELRLEIAQDTLSFLRYYMMVAPQAEVLKQLDLLYQYLDLNQLKENLERVNLFNSMETEMLDFISIAGVKALSPEDIEAIKKQQATQQAITQRLQNESQAEVKTINKSDKNLTTETFEPFLKSLGISPLTGRIYGFGDKIFRFVDLKHKNQNLSGLYNQTLQKFERVSYGPKNYESLTVYQFKNILKQTITAPETQNKETFVCNVSQTTANAKLERRFVQQKLQNAGYSASLDRIYVCDRSFQRFVIREASYQNQYEFSGEYLRSKDEISDLQVRFGPQAIKLQNTRWRLANLHANITQKLKELYPDRFNN